MFGLVLPIGFQSIRFQMALLLVACGRLVTNLDALCRLEMGRSAAVVFEFLRLNVIYQLTTPTQKLKYSSAKTNVAGTVHTDLTATRKFSFLVLCRGIQKRCPQCGVSALLIGYLKPASNCSHCGEDFSQISADDGPAWLTLLIIGHAIVPLMLVFGRDPGIPA